VDPSSSEQLERLRELGRQLRDRQRRIDLGYATLVEAMAVSSLRLAEAARTADFSAPPWPAGIRRTLEVKLAETREVTFRFQGEDQGGGPAGARGPTI